MSEIDNEQHAEDSFLTCLALLRALEGSPLDRVGRAQAVNIVAVLLIGDEFNWDDDMLDKFRVQAVHKNFDLCLMAARQLKALLEMMKRDHKNERQH